MSLGTNLLLALLWASLIGPFTPTNLALGFVVSYMLLRACVRTRCGSAYSRRALALIFLAVYTIYELIVANVRVAYYTVSRLSALRPCVLAVPIREGLSDGEITLLSSLITLTPGTLTLDIADDRSALFVHFMHVEDPKAAIAQIRDGFERRVLEVTR